MVFGWECHHTLHAHANACRRCEAAGGVMTSQWQSWLHGRRKYTINFYRYAEYLRFERCTIWGCADFRFSTPCIQVKLYQIEMHRLLEMTFSGIGNKTDAADILFYWIVYVLQSAVLAAWARSSRRMLKEDAVPATYCTCRQRCKIIWVLSRNFQVDCMIAETSAKWNKDGILYASQQQDVPLEKIVVPRKRFLEATEAIPEGN